MKSPSHFHFESVVSTQDQCFELLDAGNVPPFFVTANEQTGGRGRQGRVWISEKGRSLVMSFAVRIPAAKLSGLSLAAGLAVKECFSLENLKLKWPNDLMLDDQKVGGILTESRSHADRVDVVIGIGLNLLPMQAASYAGLHQNISSEALATAFNKSMTVFAERGFSFFKDQYEQAMWKRNQVVELDIEGVKQKVKIVGVSDEGLLISEQSGRLALSHTGEIVYA